MHWELFLTRLCTPESNTHTHVRARVHIHLYIFSQVCFLSTYAHVMYEYGWLIVAENRTPRQL